MATQVSLNSGAVSSAGSLKLQTNGTTDAVTIDTSQNVGVGTSSPNAKLDVAAGSSSTFAKFSSSNADPYFRIQNTSAGGKDWIIYSSGTGSSLAGTFRLFNNTDNLTAFTVDSSGNFLVGATATLGSTAGVLIAASGANVQTLTTDSTSGSSYYIGRFYSGGTEKGYIYYNGSTVAFTSTSDYRLKENVQPMTGALAKVAQLKPCTYTWKSNGQAGQGFIAHELAAVVPDCVSGEKDAVDEDGTPRYQGIDTSFLVATLTAAIQELNAKVVALEAKVK